MSQKPFLSLLKRWRFINSSLLLLLIAVLLTSCGTPTSSSSGPVEITYTYPSFTNNLKDLPAVQAAMNAILKQKLNATVVLKPIDSAAYDQKMKLASSAGQPCDVVFTAPWTNNFYQNVNNGNLLPLDDLLTKDAPGLYASMSPSVWNAAKVDGKIYGVINQQPFTRRFGPRIRKDLAEKYHLDLNSITSFQDLQPFLAALKKGEPGITPLITTSLYSPAFLNLDVVDGTNTDTGLLTVRADDASRKVINATMLPEFKQLVALNRQWYLAGYYPKDPLPDADAQAAGKAGKIAGEIFVVNPDSAGQLKSTYGYDFVTKPLGTPILTTGGINATMNGICRNSAHPDVAMKFLELLNTDTTLYHLIAHGIEGKDYVVVDKAKGVIGLPPDVTASTVGYNPNSPWMFGNLFNSYYNDPAIVGAWDQMRQINQSATPSVMLGFAFNPDKVKNQISQITAVETQYEIPLIQGRVDPDKGLALLQQKLNDSGVNDVINEVQSQIATWAKTK